MTVTLTVLTEDPAGPSARHRWVYPAPHFREEGFAISLQPVQPRSVRTAAFMAAAGADLVVIHRKLFRLPDFLRLLRKVSGKIVYDLDDAVMYRPSGRRRQRSLMRGLRFSRTVRHSSLYLAGNSYLAGFAPRLLPVAVRPTPVDLSRYRVREDVSERGRIVGWIGTGATLPYLIRMAEILSRLASRRDDLVLRVIGPRPPEIPGVRTEHVPWSEEGEADALCGLDVGILPLPDDPWTRGKCAFKVLQYMASGLPVVASPVGMNREVVVHGETGYLAGDAGEWEEALEGLLDDPAAREEMGRAGRRRVEEAYSTEVLTPPVARSLARILA